MGTYIVFVPLSLILHFLAISERRRDFLVNVGMLLHDCYEPQIWLHRMDCRPPICRLSFSHLGIDDTSLDYSRVSSAMVQSSPCMYAWLYVCVINDTNKWDPDWSELAISHYLRDRRSRSGLFLRIVGTKRDLWTVRRRFKNQFAEKKKKERKERKGK